jgi:menaquinone-dependent protoporphyrinogen oxidase
MIDQGESTMRVLIAVASKHGSTREIGEAIAGTLQSHNLEVDLEDVDRIDDLDRYDAVILGSAVYIGRWIEEARRFAETHRQALQDRPVWLFSSGPIGDPPLPEAESADMAAVAEQISARGARTFPGELDPSELSLKERLVTKAVRAQPGDFRPWDEIEAWANEIGADLSIT